MKLVLHPDLWELYISKVGSLINSEQEMMLVNIIKNQNNIFIYNESIQKFYTDYFKKIKSNKFDFDDVFSNFLMDLESNGRIFVEDSKKEIIDFKTLYDFYCQSVFSNFLFVKNSSIYSQIPILNFVGCFDLIDKPNQSWIYFTLLQGNGRFSSTLIHSDFKSNYEIQDVIKNLINLKNPLSRKIHIQNDYVSFGLIFDKIKGKKMTYCTSKYENGRLKSLDRLKIDKTRVKDYFGQKTAFKVSQDKKILHPRAIIYNKIVIIINHDFNEIIVGNTNWHLTFILCEKTYNEHVIVTDKYHSLD